jgi:hypothetical protein
MRKLNQAKTKITHRNQEFTNRGILIGLIVFVLGGAAKLFGFFPKP